MKFLNYKKLLSKIFPISILLIFLNHVVILPLEVLAQTPMVETNSASKLSKDEWSKLIKYSLKYVTDNKHSISLECNESGFYRINFKAPYFLSKNFKIEKLRLHYWPIDHAINIKKESIHNHPQYFESIIIYGGYKHSIYNINNKINNIATASKYHLFKVNKTGNTSKKANELGEIFLSKQNEEIVKEGNILVIPTSFIHKVDFSIPGTLSLNVVYHDQQNKNFYNVMVSTNKNKKDIAVFRDKVCGLPKDKAIDEIEALLLNAKFQIN